MVELLHHWIKYFSSKAQILSLYNQSLFSVAHSYSIIKFYLFISRPSIFFAWIENKNCQNGAHKEIRLFPFVFGAEENDEGKICARCQVSDLFF